MPAHSVTQSSNTHSRVAVHILLSQFFEGLPWLQDADYSMQITDKVELAVSDRAQ